MNILTLGVAMALNFRQEPPFEMFDTEKTAIIKAFFKHFDFAGEPVIDSKIKGKASVQVNGGKFELMLQPLLTQIGATYRYEAGKFHILPIAKKEPALRKRL